MSSAALHGFSGVHFEAGALATPTALPTGPGTLATAPLAAASPPAVGTPAPTAAVSGAPRIVSLATSPDVVHAGDTVRWDVRTTPDVSGVTAKVATYGFTFVRVAPGHFTLAFAIPPSVPFFFHGDYRLAVLAAAPAGDAKATATIRFR